MSEQVEPVRHIVLLQFRKDCPQERIDELVAGFRLLAEEIAVIERFEWGTNVSREQRNKGYTHCFQLSFASKEDLERYLRDEARQGFVEALGPELEQFLVFDYAP